MAAVFRNDHRGIRRNNLHLLAQQLSVYLVAADCQDWHGEPGLGELSLTNPFKAHFKEGLRDQWVGITICCLLSAVYWFQPIELPGLCSKDKRPGSPLAYAAASRLCLMNPSRSALIWSALVVGIPCGKPGYTFSVAFFTIFADIGAAAAIGTI